MRSVVLILMVGLTWNTTMADETEKQLSAEIQAFLNTYAETLLTMWDQSNPDPIYMAEEINPPMHGWSVLKAYFNPKPGVQVLDGIWNEYTDVRAHYLSDDLAVATYKLTYHIKVKRAKAMSGWDRVLAVFRKHEGEWKLTAYAESPMSPLTMVRKMMENAVPEEFVEHLKKQHE
jgi:hypothetical protein